MKINHCYVRSVRCPRIKTEGNVKQKNVNLDNKCARRRGDKTRSFYIILNVELFLCVSYSFNVYHPERLHFIYVENHVCHFK
jgi:hypothetical protein